MGVRPEGAKRIIKPQVDVEAPTMPAGGEPATDIMPERQAMMEEAPTVDMRQEAATVVASQKPETAPVAQEAPISFPGGKAGMEGAQASRAQVEAMQEALSFTVERAQAAVNSVAESTRNRFSRLRGSVAEFFGFGNKATGAEPDFDKQTSRVGGTTFWGTKLAAFGALALLVARGDGKAPEKGDAAPVDNANAAALQEAAPQAPTVAPEVAPTPIPVTTIEETAFEAPVVRGNADATAPGTPFDYVAGDLNRAAEADAQRRTNLQQQQEVVRKAVQDAQVRNLAEAVNTQAAIDADIARKAPALQRRAELDATRQSVQQLQDEMPQRMADARARQVQAQRDARIAQARADQAQRNAYWDQRLPQTDADALGSSFADDLQAAVVDGNALTAHKADLAMDAVINNPANWQDNEGQGTAQRMAEEQAQLRDLAARSKAAEQRPLPEAAPVKIQRMGGGQVEIDDINVAPSPEFAKQATYKALGMEYQPEGSALDEEQETLVDEGSLQQRMQNVQAKLQGRKDVREQINTYDQTLNPDDGVASN